MAAMARAKPGISSRSLVWMQGFNPWAFYCFPRLFSRELDWKQVPGWDADGAGSGFVQSPLFTFCLGGLLGKTGRIYLGMCQLCDSSQEGYRKGTGACQWPLGMRPALHFTRLSILSSKSVRTVLLLLDRRASGCKPRYYWWPVLITGYSVLL